MMITFYRVVEVSGNTLLLIGLSDATLIAPPPLVLEATREREAFRLIVIGSVLLSLSPKFQNPLEKIDEPTVVSLAPRPSPFVPSVGAGFYRIHMDDLSRDKYQAAYHLQVHISDKDDDLFFFLRTENVDVFIILNDNDFVRLVITGREVHVHKYSTDTTQWRLTGDMFNGYLQKLQSSLIDHTDINLAESHNEKEKKKEKR
ncbi:hypothetical protein Scep_028163 [Stephania cephalantha]|uniref:Uncharacterized protein n=1 Tax=Stephania cephalantha TaxID=152367 RepID=A0AAP0E9F7_9MAGN